MKFGILTYLPTANQQNWKHNLGDFIQSIVLKNIYSKMGIPDQDIISVNLFELNKYDGAYCILPINCYNAPFREGASYLPPSPKIIPVYISFHLIAHTLSTSVTQNLRAYQPIGCRDEATMLLLRKYSIPAYTTGCLTATLPARQEQPLAKQVYIIDVPEEVLPHIPKALLANAQYRTQLIIDYTKPNKDRIEEINQMAVSILEELKTQARLVITRRLHIASPCIAMGIPVVLVRNDYDTRYSWIEHFIHPYSKDEYGQINWTPQPICYEDEKEKLLSYFVSQIKSTYERYRHLVEISERFEDRKRCNYLENYFRVLENIKKLIDPTKKAYIVIWGVFIHAPYLLQLIPEMDINCEIRIVDACIEGSFENYKIQKPDSIRALPDNTVCIVTAPSIEAAASHLLKGTNIKTISIDCYDS